MDNMARLTRVETKLDRAIEIIAIAAQEIQRHRQEEERMLTHLSESLGRLDERTKQHAERMDRTERRAAAGGAGLGAMVAALVTALAEVIRRLPG